MQLHHHRDEVAGEPTPSAALDLVRRLNCPAADLGDVSLPPEPATNRPAEQSRPPKGLPAVRRRQMEADVCRVLSGLLGVGDSQVLVQYSGKSEVVVFIPACVARRGLQGGG